MGDLDAELMKYIRALRKEGGVVNTSILLAVADGLCRRIYPDILTVNGGTLDIKKTWARSFFARMGFVKRKATRAAKHVCFIFSFLDLFSKNCIVCAVTRQL